MNSRDYWKKREDEARKNTIRDEKEYNARLNEIYEYTIANIERQVNDWYARYASKEGITMAEARGRVKHIDMERYERLAAKYVATHDFSEQANQEMALYNLTMKVNRLELLKAQINLELMAGFDDIQHEMERDLIQTAMKEDRRLAGILGDSVIGNEEYAKQLVNASFRNATFSERIWGRNMPDLRVHLEAELRNGLVQGIGSVELARRFRKHYGGSIRDTERLMTTEMCRLQTAVQKESFERNGYKEYMFITSGNDNVCPDCQALHGQHFKVSEMQPGENAPPMHPRCHCSAAAYMDSDKYKRWIDALANGEDVRWNEFEQNTGLRASGAVSGALTSKNDPDFKKRDAHAKSYYRELLGRNRDKEVKAVARNSGMAEADIGKVFAHVFERSHLFEDGRIEKFAPDYDMAESWQRLREGKNIQEHDRILLLHELYEANMMGEGTDIPYEPCHEAAEKIYNYSVALKKYLRENGLE